MRFTQIEQSKAGTMRLLWMRLGVNALVGCRFHTIFGFVDAGRIDFYQTVGRERGRGSDIPIAVFAILIIDFGVRLR